MKQKLKNYLKLGILLFGISAFLVNCQQDDDFRAEPQAKDVEHKPAFTVTKITKQTISQNRTVSNVLKRIKESEILQEFDAQGRLITNETFNVVIDDEEAKYLEKADGSYHSYTFKAVDYENPDLKKNLVLSLKDDGTYKEMLITYYLTEQDLVSYQETGIIEFDASINYTEISEDVFSIDIYSRELAPVTTSDCVDVVHGDGEPCSIGGHTWTNRNQCQIYSGDTNGDPPTPGDVIAINIDMSCVSNNGGGPIGSGGDNTGEGGPPPGGDNTGGGGGTSDNPEDPDYDPTDSDTHGNGTTDGDDDPLFPPDLDEDNFDISHPKNCEELNNLSKYPLPNTPNPYVNSDTVIYPRLAIINIDDHFGEESEFGYAFYNQGYFPEYGPNATNVEASSNGLINFPVFAFQFGTIHLHPTSDNWHPMFSHDDLYSLLSIRNNYGFNNYNPNGDALFVCMLVVKHGTETYTYAIKINDISKLQRLQNIHDDEDDTSWEKFGRDMRGYYDESSGGFMDANHYQKRFLEFMEDKDLGVSLYKMNPNDPNDLDNLETWDKLTLDENNLVVTEPCN